MVNLGTSRVRILDDGWTVVTLDGRPSACFEHTIAISSDGPEILTRICYRMMFRILLGIAILFVMQQWCFAQDLAEPEPDPDPVTASTPAPAAAVTPTPPPPKATKETIWNGWKKLPGDLLSDQKTIYTYPSKMTRKENWEPTAAFVGLTSLLVYVDPAPAQYFRKTHSHGNFNTVFSGPNTAKANYLVPLALYGVGLEKRDTYAQETFLLAGRAALDSSILTSIMKDIDRRLNPHSVPTDGNFNDTWFKKPFSQHLIGGNGSFPSGHTITAFAVATVYAKRYKNHKWIPLVASSLAAIDGFSRMSLEAHFGSDVFAGAALGYVISHKVVLGGH